VLLLQQQIKLVYGNV